MLLTALYHILKNGENYNAELIENLIYHLWIVKLP